MHRNAVTYSILLLTACAQPQVCPPMPAPRHYTIAQQEQIAYERNALPQDSILREVMQEWEMLRRDLR